LDAGSSTTASIFRPSTPPDLLTSLIAISTTSLIGPSLIAIVPESECRTPTLIGSLLCAASRRGSPIPAATPDAAMTLPFKNSRRETDMAPPLVGLTRPFDEMGLDRKTHRRRHCRTCETSRENFTPEPLARNGHRCPHLVRAGCKARTADHFKCYRAHSCGR